jgi:hypothetical protein
MTVYQMRYIVLRPRDDRGRLIRHNTDLPAYVLATTDADGMRRVKHRASFAEAYLRAKMARGVSERDAKLGWYNMIDQIKEERKKGKRRNKK